MLIDVWATYRTPLNSSQGKGRARRVPKGINLNRYEGRPGEFTGEQVSGHIETYLLCTDNTRIIL